MVVMYRALAEKVTKLEMLFVMSYPLHLKNTIHSLEFK